VDGAPSTLREALVERGWGIGSTRG